MQFLIKLFLSKLYKLVTMLIIYLFLAMVSTAQAQSEPLTLKPCPDKPNCVSSQADPSDSEHYMPAIPYNRAEDEVIRLIESTLLSQPRSKLELATDNYVHVTFRSRIFRFVDDVEVILDRDAKLIHFRSAARMGQSDMGVNRKRMETFVQSLAEAVR